MANIYSLQLLRNTTQLYASKTDAMAALTGSPLPDGVNDGTPMLARYKGADGNIMTLVGFYAKKENITGASDANSHMTIFDLEGNEEKIQEILAMIGNGVTTADTVTLQLQNLSGQTNDTSASTSVKGAKLYTDDKIATLTASSVANENKVVTDVTQSNGKISATTSNITGVKLDGLSATADTKIASTQTLGAALANLQGQIDSMDLATVSGEGEVITSVSEADGKVSASKTAIKDVKLNGYVKDTTKTGTIAATDDIEDALSKIENTIGKNTVTAKDKSIVVETTGTTTEVGVNIRSGEKVLKLDTDATTGGVYTDIDLVKITTGLPAEIKERYQLLASDDSQIGANIDIPKDSHIVSITYITDSGDTHYQNLEYVYIDASGNTQTTYVDMSELILEAEFGSGVTVTNHVAHGVVDSDSEKDGQATPVPFLTVGENGFKVDGIKNEITRQINGLDAVVTGGTTAGTATSNHVQVIVGEADGKLTAVTVSETNIADKSKLDELSGKTLTNVTSANASITPTITTHTDDTKTVDLITDASKIKMTGFTSAESGFTAITTASTVTEAVKAIETEFINNEQVTAAALVDLDERVDGLSGKTVTAVEMTGGTANVVNNTTDGTKKITIDVDGSKVYVTSYAKGSDSSAIAASDTVNQALGKLENQIDKAGASATTEIVEGTDDGNNMEITHSAATDGHIVYTINLSDVASATALTAEIAARKAVDGQTGQTYAANSSAHYINNAADLNDADVKLDAKLYELSSSTVNEVQVNGVALAETNNAVNVSISATASPTANAQGINVATDSNGAITLSLGIIDAGEY